MEMDLSPMSRTIGLLLRDIPAVMFYDQLVLPSKVSIGRIGAQPDESPQLHQFILEAGEQLLDEWEQCELQDEERRLALLQSAGFVAANPALDADAAPVRDLREHALEALFSGLREGMIEVREPLLKLRDCPGLPRDQKQEIDERLAKAFGLIRIGPSA